MRTDTSQSVDAESMWAKQGASIHSLLSHKFFPKKFAFLFFDIHL